MTDETITALDRYMTLFDRYLDGSTQLDELRTIFAPDATVDIIGAPVTGIDDLFGMYEGILGRLQETKHFWNLTKVDDNTLEAEWVVAGKMKDGGVMSLGGFERAHLNAEGLIVNLRNYPNKAAA